MRTVPDYIQFYPTFNCNESCSFCFNRAMPSVPNMVRDDFHKMLGTIKTLGVKTLDILGGEPTLHPELVEYVRLAALSRLTVNISSNGTRPGVLEDILKIRGDITIGLSINDEEACLRLKGFIRSNKPVVKSVFRPDMDSALIHTIRALGPQMFYLIYRDSLAQEDLHDAGSFDRFLSAVDQILPSHKIGTVYCSGFLPDVKAYPELTNMRCPAGTTKLGIMPDGNVYPCNLFFGKQEFLLGNILTDSFKSIWSHKALDFFRFFIRNTCPKTTCELHSRCHGGCPAHSFAHFRTLAAPDPRCVGS